MQIKIMKFETRGEILNKMKKKISAWNKLFLKENLSVNNWIKISSNVIEIILEKLTETHNDVRILAHY